MSSLSTVTLGDITAAARRYQPVVLGVAVLLVVFTLLPEPARVAGKLEDAASLLDRTRASASGGSSETAPGAVPAVADASAVDPAFSTASFDASDTAFSSGEDSFASSSAGDDLGVTFDGPSIDSDTSSSAEPLRIVSSTWASRSSGTPVAAEGIPAGTLPVGVRVSEDKLSFLRLAGSATVLELHEDAAGERQTNGPIAVQLCQVTIDSWGDGEAIAMQEAPPHDSASCVLGMRNDAGVWTFDMQTFDSPTDKRGFTLRPGEGAGLDWQVTFKKSA